MPLMSELREDGVEWRLNTTDYRWPMTRGEMVEWYCQLDLLVSTSIIDGTPSPPFEAAACGVPFLSTDVGCVSDWKEAREMGCAGPACGAKRDVVSVVEWFANKIRQYRDNRNLLAQTGQALCSAVQEYSYETIARRYLEAICG
jgi:glycosyltransferase involved in cell wall biosynthesis